MTFGAELSLKELKSKSFTIVPPHHKVRELKIVSPQAISTRKKKKSIAIIIMIELEEMNSNRPQA
jgi:hypothetical protein